MWHNLTVLLVILVVHISEILLYMLTVVILLLNVIHYAVYIWIPI